MKLCAIDTKELEDKLLTRFAENQDDELLEDLSDYVINSQKEVERLENIIKEVREYIEEWQRFPHTNGSTHKELKNLIDILDKENKDE